MREAYMREGTDHHDDKKLNRVAKECYGCKSVSEWPVGTCKGCYNNIARYTDVTHAALIRTDVLNETHNNNVWLAIHNGLDGMRFNSGHAIGWVPLILLCSFLIWCCPSMPDYSTGSKYTQTPTSYTQTQTKAEYKSGYEMARDALDAARKIPPTYTTTESQRTIAKIEATVKKVNAKRRDMNGDGKWNCQDAVRQFREIWPESTTILNEHIGPTGHLFIQVPLGDDVIYVEPQNTVKWRMRDAWPEWARVKQYNKVISWI